MATISLIDHCYIHDDLFVYVLFMYDREMSECCCCCCFQGFVRYYTTTKLAQEYDDFDNILCGLRLLGSFLPRAGRHVFVLIQIFEDSLLILTSRYTFKSILSYIYFILIFKISFVSFSSIQ